MFFKRIGLFIAGDRFGFAITGDILYHGEIVWFYVQIYHINTFLIQYV